jgi:hypothetical protein
MLHELPSLCSVSSHDGDGVTAAGVVKDCPAPSAPPMPNAESSAPVLSARFSMNHPLTRWPAR